MMNIIFSVLQDDISVKSSCLNCLAKQCSFCSLSTRRLYLDW